MPFCTGTAERPKLPSTECALSEVTMNVRMERILEARASWTIAKSYREEPPDFHVQRGSILGMVQESSSAFPH